MLYDTLLVVPLFMAAAGVWVAILGPTDSLNDPAVPAGLQRLSWLLTLLLCSGFFGRRAGQSLRMHPWRLKLVTDSGGSPTWRQVAVRLLGALLSALSLGAGYWWRFVPPHRRYWHDRLSQTYLVLIPKDR